MEARLFKSGRRQIVLGTMNVGLDGGNCGRGREKIDVMPVVAGSKIDDFGMVSRMVPRQEYYENANRFIGLAHPLIFEWE